MLNDTEKEQLGELIDEYIKKYSTSTNPFLEHIEYFKGTDGISACSISKKLSELTQENRLATIIKGKLTMRAANQSVEAKGCPYRSTFETSKDLMPCLKHPCDSGIINKDGSINIPKLKEIAGTYFDYNMVSDKWFLTKSSIFEYLNVCAARDKELPQYGACYIPWRTVANKEWTDFFFNFHDYEVEQDLAVTLDTFLQFYFNPLTLYKKRLDKHN
jgi:hypothetical protein